MSFRILIVAVCWLRCVPALFAPLCADELSDAVRAAAATVAPSVVRVRTIGTPGSDDLAVTSQITTGLVISDSGEVLTSVFGFTADPAAIFVEDSSGKKVAAQVVAKDHVRKLVLLKCPGGQFRPVQPSADRWPQVGAWAVALGKLYPGSQPSISVGIVSAVRRIHGLAIQTDAKISPVNYGGPLVDLEGRVTGILVPLSPQDTGDGISAGVEWYDSGIGFAIPLIDAMESAAQLRNGQNRVKGLIGIQPSTRNPLTEEFSIDLVLPESPAAAAGLRKGDRIIEANGMSLPRFGIFDAIARSSYAGENLNLVVVRDQERIVVDLVLAARLQRPQPGYLGLITADDVGEPGTAEYGIQALTVSDSPAASAGLPESVLLTKWDDQPLKSVDDLRRLLSALTVNASVSLSFRLSADEAEEKAIAVTASERPQRLSPVSESVVKAVADGGDELSWSRQEETLGEDAGKVWLFAPETSLETQSGLVVLLSEAGSPQQGVLAKWRDVCRQQNLILMVPSNAEGTALSREDASLVPAAIAKVISGRSIDARRTVLVANDAQAVLCSELLLDPRLRQLRAAAFVDCRPGISGLPQQALTRKSPSILILTGTVQSRQSQALLEQSVRQLNDAGSWVIRENLPAADADNTSPEELIAQWVLTLKAR